MRVTPLHAPSSACVDCGVSVVHHLIFFGAFKIERHLLSFSNFVVLLAIVVLSVLVRLIFFSAFKIDRHFLSFSNFIC